MSPPAPPRSFPQRSPIGSAIDRRTALRSLLTGAAVTMIGGAAAASSDEPATPKGSTSPRAPEVAPVPPFRISLAQWSLNRAFFKGGLDPMDFASIAAREYGIDAIEYVNQFYMSKVADAAVFAALRRRADDAGVTSLLIMCDGIGALGDPDPAARRRAVEGHKPWLDHARTLGCHSIRVNAASSGTWEEQRDRASDGLHQLAVLGDAAGLNVLVENHGGLSSNGRWLAETIRAVDHPRCGTLPDCGNFSIGKGEVYDRYQGVRELMPFARAVSAKSHDFDDAGDETGTDYARMMRIVLDAGYRGHVGIEYEGTRLAEADGIRATQRLLQRIARLEASPT